MSYLQQALATRPRKERPKSDWELSTELVLSVWSKLPEIADQYVNVKHLPKWVELHTFRREVNHEVMALDSLLKELESYKTIKYETIAWVLRVSVRDLVRAAKAERAKSDAGFLEIMRSR